jgi:hypothetical protein
MNATATKSGEATAVTQKTMSTVPKRKKMSAEDKAKRAEFLKAEPKEAKLLRLAKSRVTRAVNSIKFVGNLAAYKPNDEQIDKIMQAIGGTAASVEARLRGTKRDGAAFSL